MKYLRRMVMVSFLLISVMLMPFTFAEDPPLPVPVGRVVWIKGTLLAVMPSKEERKLQQRSVIYLHDTLITDAKSYAQIVFTDNTLMTFKPGTKFFIAQYAFDANGKKHSLGKSIMNLIEGGFRTITGIIAKDNPDNYQVNTAVATIGVRGTDYAVTIKNGKVFVGYYSGRPCVKGKKSSAEVCLDAKTQYVEVDAQSQVPVPLTQQPAELSEKLQVVPATISPFTSNNGGYKPGNGGAVTSFCITQ